MRDRRVLLAIDYGQIEYRVLAMLSGDPVICKALVDKYDVHMDWAIRLSKAAPELLRRHDGNMKALRSVVKNLFVFPAFYKASERSIAAYLKLDQRVISPVFEEFWDVFAGVKAWQDRTIAFFREHGYVQSPTGRRRFAPLSTSAIVNTPIQGGASDIVIDAMSRLARRSFAEQDENILARLNIHDDLTFSPLLSKLEESMEKIVPMMLHPPKPMFDWVTVPLSVECSAGPAWGSLKPLGTFYSDDEP